MSESGPFLDENSEYMLAFGFHPEALNLRRGKRDFVWAMLKCAEMSNSKTRSNLGVWMSTVGDL